MVKAARGRPRASDAEDRWLWEISAHGPVTHTESFGRALGCFPSHSDSYAGHLFPSYPNHGSIHSGMPEDTNVQSEALLPVTLIENFVIESSMRTLPIIGYIRVSTDRQADEGFGLEVQEVVIRDWCSARGHELVGIHRDEGLSGSLDAGERPGLSAALETIESGEAEALVVHKLDRLARSLTVQEAALAHIWRSGGEVFSVDAGAVLRDDPDDPVRTAMRQMIGVFSQLERGMISARMRAGRRLKAERGGYAGGRPRYGYRAEERELVPVFAEQEAIRLASQLRCKGLSYRAIACELESAGFKRRGGSARWHAIQVARALDGLTSKTSGSSVE